MTAPPIRGLKPTSSYGRAFKEYEAINDRPAHQGIETQQRVPLLSELLTGTINDRPAHQGIETRGFRRERGPGYHLVYQ